MLTRPSAVMRMNWVFGNTVPVNVQMIASFLKTTLVKRPCIHELTSTGGDYSIENISSTPTHFASYLVTEEIMALTRSEC
jgi:hypothetical protein